MNFSLSKVYGNFSQDFKPVSSVNQKLTAYCTSCKQYEDFTFLGHQLFDNERVFDLYNCSFCGTTKAFNFSEKYGLLEKKLNKILGVDSDEAN